MMDFMFFVKTFALTLIVIVAMQIQIGDRSVESHTVDWVQSSSITQPLNGVAQGAAKLIHDITKNAYSAIHSKITGRKQPHSP